jgi:hypothetical protein
MKAKLLTSVALLIVGLGSVLAGDLAVRPTARAPIYKAPPTVPAVPPADQDRENSGPTTEGDWKVAALGCTYVVFVSVQAFTAACGWARQPADDAIDEAIVALDDFILANTSSHFTRPMLEDLKRQVWRPTGQYCENPNELVTKFRNATADQLREAVKVLISRPAEPRPYPCL